VTLSRMCSSHEDALRFESDSCAVPTLSPCAGAMEASRLREHAALVALLRASTGSAAGGEHAAELPDIALAVVTSDRRVLVSRRVDQVPAWSLVGGEVEPGELAEAAAVREVAEESGLKAEAAERIGEKNHPQTGRHVIYVGCRLAAGSPADPVVRDGAELLEVRWASLADALSLMPALDGRVKDYLARTLRVGPAPRK
jgi:8-oxo-dGTP diphosphatase